ncbi:MAG: hypothetical protein V2B20_13665 [Pseudomonadota bacterium]
MFVKQPTDPTPHFNRNSLVKALSNRRISDETITKLLDDNTLTCHFQPILNLQQAKIFAYEALCRTIEANPFYNIEILAEKE